MTFRLLYCLICIGYVTGIVNVQCPSYSQWNLRAGGFCNSSKSKSYYCLYDGNSDIYNEFCADMPSFEKPGFKSVLLGGLTGEMCERSRFQPFKFWTNGNSGCVFDKSTCSGEGQIAADNGTTTGDRSCRCDYTRGYSFVNPPLNNCSCVPSISDCSCYLKTCLTGSTLNQDYQCSPGTVSGETFYCLPITEISTSQTTIPVVANDFKQMFNVIRYSSVIVLKILILLVTPFLLMILIRSRYYKKCWLALLTRPQCSTTTGEKMTSTADIRELFGSVSVSTQTLRTELEASIDLPFSYFLKGQEWTRPDDLSELLRHASVSTQTPRTEQEASNDLRFSYFLKDNATLSAEKRSYLAIVELLLIISPMAVREHFDKIFQPKSLQNLLNQERIKLLDLHKRNAINRSQLNVLFPMSGSVSSSNFDVELMILLIKKLSSGKQYEAVRESKTIDEETALSTIKHYRNVIIRSTFGLLNTSEFERLWNEITEAVICLGGKGFEEVCSELRDQMFGDG